MILPLPTFPKILNLESPEITKVMDSIRHSLDDEDHFEFYWFAREYPRFFRSQIYQAQYRLENIFAKYRKILEENRLQIPNEKGFIGMAVSNRDVEVVYWEFEAFLNSVNTSLELIARILTPAFKNQSPITFNKLCKKSDLSGLVEILRKDKKRWVDRMKNYRDCFVHFSGVDTLQRVGFNQYADGIEMRAKIPVNPEIREQDGFRFNRKGDVLRYSIFVYKCLRSLDRKIAKKLKSLHTQGEFPARIMNLHFVAPRQ